MLFKKLRTISVARLELLPFVSSLEEHEILVAIGEADEAGCPLGYKQLALLKLAPPSTLQRRLKKLLLTQVIEKVGRQVDGRRVAYALTDRTTVAYQRFVSRTFR